MFRIEIDIDDILTVFSTLREAWHLFLVELDWWSGEGVE